MAFNMNKQRGAHMDGKPAGAQDVEQESGQHHLPHIHIHSHTAGHTVHVLHHDGTHTMHEHSHGDADSIAEHIHKHIGGAPGQTHGVGDGILGEDEGAAI
jgi:hypothetical protein